MKKWNEKTWNGIKNKKRKNPLGSVRCDNIEPVDKWQYFNEENAHRDVATQRRKRGKLSTGFPKHELTELWEQTYTCYTVRDVLTPIFRHYVLHAVNITIGVLAVPRGCDVVRLPEALTAAKLQSSRVSYRQTDKRGDALTGKQWAKQRVNSWSSWGCMPRHLSQCQLHLKEGKKRGNQCKF